MSVTGVAHAENAMLALSTLSAARAEGGLPPSLHIGLIERFDYPIGAIGATLLTEECKIELFFHAAHGHLRAWRLDDEANVQAWAFQTLDHVVECVQDALRTFHEGIAYVD